MLKEIDEAVATSCKTGVAESNLVKMLKDYGVELEKHLRGEEDDIQVRIIISWGEKRIVWGG